MKKDNDMKTMRFYTDATKAGLPFVQMQVDESKGIIMLIDTGSNNNIIFGYAYEQLKDRLKDAEEKSYLYGIDGNKSALNIVKGQFSICGKESEMFFLLREDDEAGNMLSQEMGFPIAGIIGTNFMIEHGWKIDFARQEIIIPDADVSVEDFQKAKKDSI